MSRFLLEPSDPRWPAALADLEELEPSLGVKSLWVEGELPELPGMALVGSRRPTAAGLEVARRIGADLGRRGITVVSGFARGVDAAAHRGCLSAGGRTLAVLGCGLSVDYPSQHTGLRTDVSLSGALMSEYTAWDTPLRWHFPHRNRIIAAISRAVVVVEAGAESGALSTARWAADLGREVLAVPGSILGQASAGSNRLLRDGVRPYLDISDLADVFPGCGDGLPIAGQDIRGSGTDRPIGPGRRLLELLGPEPVHREVLCQGLGLGAADLAVLVGEMELAGSLRTLPGGLICRTRW